MKARTTGFEFEVSSEGGPRRWVRPQGSGGLVGAGCLATFDRISDAERQGTLNYLLRRVRADAAERGTLRVLLDDTAEPAERFGDIPVDTVHAVRVVGGL